MADLARTPTGVGIDTAQYWTTPLACGHAPTAPTSFHGNGVPLTSGAATAPDGARMCYACADALQRATVAASDTFDAYVNGAGTLVTTWTGGELARVTGHGYSGRAGFGHGLHYWTARTPDGRTWHGRNAGPGMCVTFRAHRGQAVPAADAAGVLTTELARRMARPTS